MTCADLQYLADADGKLKAVVVPIDTWRDIESELETNYLLRSEAMRQRLLEALRREQGIPLDQALTRLGVSEDELK
jgi:PHD/YefM family antitoxin component YafN of YafNO toxin-antitoxin module